MAIVGHVQKLLHSIFLSRRLKDTNDVQGTTAVTVPANSGFAGEGTLARLLATEPQEVQQ